MLVQLEQCSFRNLKIRRGLVQIVSLSTGDGMSNVDTGRKVRSIQKTTRKRWGICLLIIYFYLTNAVRFVLCDEMPSGDAEPKIWNVEQLPTER